MIDLHLIFSGSCLAYGLSKLFFIDPVFCLSIIVTFIEFLEKTRKLGIDYDVMLECKEKDVALFKLVDDRKILRPEYKWIDNTTLLL